MDVKVSLDVFKALTARLAFEGHTYDDVLRDLLGLDAISEPEPPRPTTTLTRIAEAFATTSLSEPDSGFTSRGLWLPNGTKLRARYRDALHTAEIVENVWKDERGNIFGSPSAAASAITGNNVNGLRFWDAKRPSEHVWRRLELIARET
jgi:hypothetical protein